MALLNSRIVKGRDINVRAGCPRRQEPSSGQKARHPQSRVSQVEHSHDQPPTTIAGKALGAAGGEAARPLLIESNLSLGVSVISLSMRHCR